MALAPRIVQRIPDCLRRRPANRLAASLDNSRTYEQFLLAEIGIAHSLFVGLEISDGFTDFFFGFQRRGP